MQVDFAYNICNTKIQCLNSKLKRLHITNAAVQNLRRIRKNLSKAVFADKGFKRYRKKKDICNRSINEKIFVDEISFFE